jgi:signal transduction histidine kinase
VRITSHLFAPLSGVVLFTAVGAVVTGIAAAGWIAALGLGIVLWRENVRQRRREETLEQLTKKLKKRNRQKNKFTKKLKRLTRQQSEIISAIGHEFKNPVAAIIGYARTLRDDPDVSPDLQAKFLDKVIRNGERIDTMVDRLSLAIRVENGDLPLHKEPFDLRDIVEESIENLRQKYPDRTVKTDLSPVTILADRIMMLHVLGNLLDNALKYSDAPVTVRLTSARLDVIDRGIGIAPDRIDKITRRFYRAHTRSWDNSLGVGLFIVSYLLKRHDARLTIVSTPDEGSRFGFDLRPLYPPRS